MRHNHKTVAVRVDLKHGKVQLSLLGQSPRGTRFIYDSVKGKVDRKDKEAFRKELEELVEKLLPAAAVTG